MLVLLPVSVPALAQYVGTSPATQPPPAAAPATAFSRDLSIYPKNGQGSQQQSADLYQCYRWARGETGFDPTQANGGVAPQDVPFRQAQYRRAMTACLEAHGYEVHYAAPVPPPSPPPGAPPPPYLLPAVIPESSRPPELTYQRLSGQVEGGFTPAAGTTSDALRDGGNVGLGITWFPSATVPLGLRADASYSFFGLRHDLLAAGGTGFTFGHEDLYGGDADLQLDLTRPASYAKLYLLGGVGEYRTWTELKMASFTGGCGPFFCGFGGYPTLTAVDRYTSAWHGSWNAGFGAEFALSDRTSLFVEARYQRILPYSRALQFVPVRVGLRF
ncbi:MAG TPA: hypothetical protein VMD49_08190 [Steroidobacteraceae bacterium]|nr:hypothetical protein [Steroidobacteraceae bacterium]